MLLAAFPALSAVSRSPPERPITRGDVYCLTRGTYAEYIPRCKVTDSDGNVLTETEFVNPGGRGAKQMEGGETKSCDSLKELGWL